MAKFILFDAVTNILAARYDSAINDVIPPEAVEVTDDQFFQTINEQDGVWTIGADAEITKQPFPTEPIAALRARLMLAVDSYISGIYNKFTRFDLEYQQREAAARAFKAASYAGDAGVWVTAFATNAGMTGQQAADLIISQADALHTALEGLAAQRMRKYAIAAATTKTAANNVYNDIIAQADIIAAPL